ncbi:MAG: hypothetical protein AUG44_20570 [Actinobacteria bacterium 13_1_20CM_3_71_11]|nr:MAG: hypothetical protein AUG44_20570 [Actinobacteria bacterium 13_1_20CM_3_71_11]
MLATGDVLNERYRLDDPVAGGGMGEVWRATDLALGRTVAVKVLRPALLRDPSFEARFRAEARTMAALSHRHIANVYDFGRSVLPEGTVTYLVMAYVDGQQLSEKIAASGRLPAGETMSIVAQAADALDAAHRLGVVHRDVKPANLLISADGTVTLVDFGIARSTAATALTTGQTVLGTALYMAPEQASGGTVGPAVDLYALGAVAYHALAGQPPFPGENALEIALRHVSDLPPPLPGDVPPAARTVVERAMAKDPADRYASAADLATAARAAAAEPDAVVPVPMPVPVPADTDELPAPVPPRRRRRTGLLAASALVALLGLIGLLALLTPGHPASTSPTPTSASAPPSATTPSPAPSPASSPPPPRPSTPPPTPGATATSGAGPAGTPPPTGTAVGK